MVYIGVVGLQKTPTPGGMVGSIFASANKGHARLGATVMMSITMLVYVQWG